MSLLDFLVVDSKITDPVIRANLERWKEQLNFILNHRFDDSKSSTIGAGLGVVNMSSANSATNSQWIPVVYEGTTYWVPAWATNSP